MERLCKAINKGMGVDVSFLYKLSFEDLVTANIAYTYIEIGTKRNILESKMAKCVKKYSCMLYFYVTHEE